MVKMGDTKMPPKRSSSSDDFYTPDWAIEILEPYIKKDWKIWECCAGTGNIVRFFKEREFDIFGTDLKTGEDFLVSNREDFGCIITNPPFSLKDKFLEKCYSYKKPFAMLLPLTALEGKFRQSLYRKHGVQVILFDKRVNYQGHNGDNGCWFPSCWICFNMELPRDLNFVQVNSSEEGKARHSSQA